MAEIFTCIKFILVSVNSFLKTKPCKASWFQNLQVKVLKLLVSSEKFSHLLNKANQNEKPGTSRRRKGNKRGKYILLEFSL